MGDMVKTEFKNLKAEMTRAGITFSEMAKMIGIGESTFYGKRNGSYDWTLSEMIAIQKILQERTELDLPLDYLFKDLPLDYLFKASSRKGDVMSENISNY